MNQPALQEQNVWDSADDDVTRAKILLAWVESKEPAGKYLKQLRELQQKTVKELATELGVSISQLNALETNNKDELPAPIYIKSYTQRYCVCLGISENEIASVLEEMSKEVLPTLNRVSIKHDANAQQLILRWAGYAVITAALVLSIYALNSMDFGGIWNTFSSTSSVVESTTALELPVVVESINPE